MKATLTFPQELITGIDVANTLNGGTSEPFVRLEHFPTFRKITLRVPGIDAENIKIEVNNNQLMIYYFTHLVSQRKDLKFPKVIYNKSIPYFVDISKIVAEQEENGLVVRLQFNELANGYHRDISPSGT